MLRLQRGDTIIEVLLAVTIFSLLSVGSMTIMNQGTNAAQRALEITQVRQQIDAQGEALRAAHQAFTAATNPSDPNLTWRQITSSTDTSDFQTTDSASGCPEIKADDIAGSFIMDARNGTKAPDSPIDWFNSIAAPDAPTHAKVVYTPGTNDLKAHGIWIERKLVVEPTMPAAYDFSIRACWFSAGQTVPVQIDTLVRLYEPI